MGLDLEQATNKATEFLKEKGGQSTCRPVSGKCEGAIYKIEIDVGPITKQIIVIQIDAETGEVIQCQDSKVQWRPEGWKNPFSIANGADPADGQRYIDYENGASAMLEASKKEEKIKARDRRDTLLCKLKANIITRDEAIELDEILDTEEDAAKERGDTVAILTIGLGRALLASLLAMTGKI